MSKNLLKRKRNMFDFLKKCSKKNLKEKLYYVPEMTHTLETKIVFKFLRPSQNIGTLPEDAESMISLLEIMIALDLLPPIILLDCFLNRASTSGVNS